MKVTLNRGAIRDLLRSPGVEADLRRRAERIAGAAGPGHTAESETGRNRARAVVYTSTLEAAIAEARNRNLSRAVDAGR